jgi:hypothetical protein
MIALLISLMLIASPVSPAGNGNHKGWRNKKTPPPPPRPPAEQVAQPGAGGGAQGPSSSERPTSRYYID